MFAVKRMTNIVRTRARNVDHEGKKRLRLWEGKRRASIVNRVCSAYAPEIDLKFITSHFYETAPPTWIKSASN